MDEIEFKQAMMQACVLVEHMDASENRVVLQQLLCMVQDLHERLIEMQVEEDDEE